MCSAPGSPRAARIRPHTLAGPRHWKAAPGMRSAYGTESALLYLSRKSVWLSPLSL